MSGKAICPILLLGLLLAGCASPSKANIALRKENQALRQQIEQLNYQRQADQARIEGLEKSVGTAPTLSEARLRQMFAAHRVEIGRLSGGEDLDPDKPGDEGFKVYFTPLDETGEPIKATGELDVKAVDLSAPEPLILGHCHFDAAAMKDLWRSFGPIHAFVIEFPWQTLPRHEQVALQVTFRDALTDRLFTALHEIQVKLPASTTRPVTMAP